MADAGAVREIRRLVHRLSPDLVHLNSSKAGVVGRVALAFSQVPVVFTAHGWAFAASGTGTLIYATIERSVASFADAIVCVSKWDRKVALARRIGSPGRLHVIQNGVAVEGTPPVRGPWPDEPRLACIARPSPQKDLPLLVKALSVPGLENWHLDVFGDGPDRGAVDEQIMTLGLSNRAHLLGDHANLTDQLPRYDALALPSNWEGLPFSILEGMAAGLPVVASDVGGVAEAVVDGETGLLVPRGDVEGFATALRRLAEDGPWARSLGLAGHTRVRNHFSAELMFERYDLLYRSLIGRGLRRLPSMP